MGGPVWGTATEELNATILEWGPREGPGETVGRVDVVLAVLAGSIELEVDGGSRTVRAGEVAVLEKGRRRRIAAGPDGARYVSVHRRREGLRIATLPRP